MRVIVELAKVEPDEDDILESLEAEFGLGEGDDYYYWLMEQSESDN